MAEMCNSTSPDGCRYWNADGISVDEARWRLARFLYETMEHLDPSDGREWRELSDNERSYYRDVIMALLDMEGLYKAGLG